MRMLIDDPTHKDYDFYFILGSDLLGELDRWKFADQLKNELKFIIFLRMGYKLREKVLPKYYAIVYTSFAASSSSEIRNRIRALRKYGMLDAENLNKEKNYQERKKSKEREKKNQGDQSNENKENDSQESNKDHEKVKIVSKAVLPYGDMDDDNKINVVKMYDLVKIKELDTITNHNKQNIQGENVHHELEKNYLGIYGIVPYVIIKYILEYDLYHE